MKKRDIIIIAVILVVALASIPVVRYIADKNATPKDFVRIYKNDALYEVLPLNEEKLVTIDQGNGVVNEVQITADGKVYMKDSTCDNQECVDMGEMSLENYEQRPLRNWIVCLPHQISIELGIGDETK